MKHGLPVLIWPAPLSSLLNVCHVEGSKRILRNRTLIQGICAGVPAWRMFQLPNQRKTPAQILLEAVGVWISATSEQSHEEWDLHDLLAVVICVS